MRVISILLFGAVFLAQAVGCSGAQFEGAAPGTKSAKKNSAGSDDGADDGADDGGDVPGTDPKEPGPSTDQGNAKPDSDETSDSAQPEDPVLTEEEIKTRRTECWFAVSGGYLAGGQYNSTFPKTKTGEPVGHSQTFDDVGGVFLQARSEPYVVGEGGKEIDLAVARTFDSIAIAPGMHAEVRDAGGAILFQGDGPEFIYSSDYGTHALIFQASTFMQTNITAYPDWMQTILKAKNFLPERKPLHAARSVLVKKIPGKRCDF